MSKDNEEIVDNAEAEYKAGNITRAERNDAILLVIQNEADAEMEME